MRQILFTIPLHDWLGFLPNVPIYGYGLMLFFAFIFCNALARRMFKRQGYDPDLVLDMAIWLFVAGIVGARIVYVIQYWPKFAQTPGLGERLLKIVALWDGGLVLYGSIFGGALGYFAYYHFYLRKHGVSNWKMLDVVAPCIPLGIALGRIGCLFTGCCYGDVACTTCPQLHFPLGSPAMQEMVRRNYQTPFGILLDDRTLMVEAVEPGSAAAIAGVQRNDKIVQINGRPVTHQDELWRQVGALQLTVERDGVQTQLELPEFTPRSIGVNPTQIYETISMCLLLFFLLSYYPFRRREGELFVLLMVCYGIHRYLNEMLRTDTDPVAFGLTLSQNVSLLVLAMGAILAFFVYRRPPLTEAQT